MVKSVLILPFWSSLRCFLNLKVYFGMKIWDQYWEPQTLEFLDQPVETFSNFPQSLTHMFTITEHELYYAANNLNALHKFLWSTFTQQFVLAYCSICFINYCVDKLPALLSAMDHLGRRDKFGNTSANILDSL